MSFVIDKSGGLVSDLFLSPFLCEAFPPTFFPRKWAACRGLLVCQSFSPSKIGFVSSVFWKRTSQVLPLISLVGAGLVPTLGDHKGRPYHARCKNEAATEYVDLFLQPSDLE